MFFWFGKWLVNAVLPISPSSNWPPPCKPGQKWLPETSSFQIGKLVPSGNLKSRPTLMAQTPQRNIIRFPVLFFPISLMVWKAWVLSLERPSLGGILQPLSLNNLKWPKFSKPSPSQLQQNALLTSTLFAKVRRKGITLGEGRWWDKERKIE